VEFDYWWLLGLLPLFFGFGWMAARIDIRHLLQESRALPRSYFKGLNFLLNEQPDKAIEAFIEVVKVDPETVELHFALGSLFRRESKRVVAVDAIDFRLAAGEIVLCDRYFDSTIAYQGYGHRQDLAEVRAVGEDGRQGGRDRDVDRDLRLREPRRQRVEERADERLQIAGYLHDDLAQVLFRLSIQVDVARKLLDKGDIPEVGTQLEKIRESKQETSDRIRALIRRAAGHSSGELECGGLQINSGSGRVTVDGDPVKLTAQEFRLLDYLMHHKGKIVSRTELTEHIYDQDFDRESNTIEVFVGRLRKKLGGDYIKTVRGLGYKLSPPGDEA